MKTVGYVLLFVLIVFLIFRDEDSSQYPNSNIPMPDEIFDPTQGIVVAMPFKTNIDIFLYRAAFSGQFSNVYSLANMPKEIRPGHYEKMDIIRRYIRIDDFEKCTEISSPERIGAADRDWYSQDRLHQPKAFAAQLLEGTCVEAPLQETHQARYKLSTDKGPILVEDLVTGVTYKTPIRFLHDERVWALFGLQKYELPSYTNRIDPLEVDNLSLEDIERALYGSRETQLAVLELLGNRVQVERNAGFQVKMVDVRPTDPSIADLLIQSGAFRSTDRRIRRFALKAAATMPSQKEKLFPEVIAALTTTIVPKPLTPKEEKEKARIEKNPRGRSEILRTNRHLFEDKSPTPGYVYPELVNAAGYVAARFGREASDAFIEQVPPYMIEKLGWAPPVGRYDQNTLTQFDSTGLYLAFIVSSEAENRALKMLSGKAQRSRLDRTGLEVFLATMPSMPTSVESEMVKKCADALAGEASRLSPLFCNSMLARRGDQGALDAILSDMETGNKKTRQLAARVLLLNHGQQGIETLKKAALNDNDTLAMAMLCHLGKRAGEDVIERVSSLASSSEEGKRLTRINKWCQRPDPTRLGLFAS